MKTKRVVEVIGPIIRSILTKINKEDPRFGSEDDVARAGSYYQGLKVKQADEFDFTVPMVSLGLNAFTLERNNRMYGFNRPVPDTQNTVPQDIQIVSTNRPLPPPPVGHMFTYIKNDVLKEQHADVMYDEDIIPFLIRRLFKELVTKAIKDLGLRDQVRVDKLVHGPAITLKIKTEDIPFEVSVDFAPMIEGGGMFPPEINWPRPGSVWPSVDKIQMIKEEGINVVAKKDFDWTLSFAECEAELIYEIDADGGVRKKCLRIMKSLRDKFWCPRGIKQVLTSFHLKNILFWECEMYFPNSIDWEEERLAERFLGMTRRLVQHIEQGQLPMYFYPDVNLFKDKDSDVLDSVKNRIENFLPNAGSQLEILIDRKDSDVVDRQCEKNQDREFSPKCL